MSTNQSLICYFEPAIHDHWLYFFLYKINIYVLLPAGLLGLVINISAFIFLHRQPKIDTGVFIHLKLLLLFDMLVIAITMFNRLSHNICDYIYDPEQLLYRPCIYRARLLHHLLLRIESLVTTMHFYLIAALTTHRYWKIARPFQSRLHDTKRRSYAILFSMLLAIFVFRLPTFILELKLTIVPTPRIVIVLAHTVIMSNYRIIYHSIINPIVSQLLPFLWTTIFSALTLIQVYRRAKGEPALNDASLNNSFVSFNTQLRRIRLSHSSSNRRRNYERSEIRATLFIASIVNICLFCYSVQIYIIARKWHLLLSGTCPNRFDFLISSIETVLEIVSTSVNVCVFTRFTKQMANLVIKRTKIIDEISTLVSLLKK